MPDEKRTNLRANTEIQILFKELGAFSKVYMLNVSNGGLFIKTDDPLPLEKTVVLRLQLPGETEMMEIEGRVIWNNPKGVKNSFPRGMGIQFVKMEPENQETIEAFVKKHREEIEHHSIM